MPIPTFPVLVRRGIQSLPFLILIILFILNQGRDEKMRIKRKIGNKIKREIKIKRKIKRKIERDS